MRISNQLGCRRMALNSADIRYEFCMLHHNMESTGNDRRQLYRTLNDTSEEERIKNCIKRHHTLLLLWSMVQKCYGPLLTSPFAGVIIIMATTFFKMNTVWASDVMVIPVDVLFLGSGLFYLFVDCYAGSTIADLNDGIRFAVYGSNWINCGIEYKKQMIMIMCYSHKLLQLKPQIGPEASLASFINMMKLSLSYFNVLRAMKHE